MKEKRTMRAALAIATILINCPLLSSQTASVQISKVSRVEQELKAIERMKDESYTKRDKDALNRIYADDYVAINAAGGTSTRKDVLKFVDTIIYESHVSSDITVREFDDFAIVTGTYSFKYKKPAVGDDSGQYRYTSVYVRRSDQWQIAAEQFTRIKK